MLDAYEPPPALEETTDLDWQVCELEPLAFLLSDLLNRLCFKLQGLNLAAAEIRVVLKLAEGSRFERAVSLSYPLADPRVLLTLVRLDLAAHQPGDAIEGVSVSAKPVPRRMMQFAFVRAVGSLPREAGDHPGAAVEPRWAGSHGRAAGG